MSFSFHRIPIGICNCFLLRGEKTILVDAGAQGGMPSFVRTMKKLNVDPKSIDLILLTHGHWDHITCLKEVQDMTGAKVAVHSKDQYMVESGEPPFPDGTTSYGRLMSWTAKKILHPHLPKIKVDMVLDDEGLSLHEYGIPGKVVYTPGHSQGHCSILLDSGDAIVGDMAMNEWYLRLTPGLPVLADDINTVVQSWRNILPMGIKRVHPAHGMDFPIEVMQKEIANFK
jgi:glyoxylase-like metal-dependent hydrolase (beta-lactamase superfamily II)